MLFRKFLAPLRVVVFCGVFKVFAPSGVVSLAEIAMLKESFWVAAKSGRDTEKTLKQLFEGRQARARYLFDQARFIGKEGEHLPDQVDWSQRISLLREAWAMENEVGGGFIREAHEARKDLGRILSEVANLAQIHLEKAELKEALFLTELVVGASKDLTDFTRKNLYKQQQELWKERALLKEEDVVVPTEADIAQPAAGTAALQRTGLESKKDKLRKLRREDSCLVAQVQVREWITQAEKTEDFASKAVFLRQALVLARLCGFENLVCDVFKLLDEVEVVERQRQEACVQAEEWVAQAGHQGLGLPEKIEFLEKALPLAKLSANASFLGSVAAELKASQQAAVKRSKDLFAEACRQPADDLVERAKLLKEAWFLAQSVDDVAAGLGGEIEDEFSMARKSAKDLAGQVQGQVSEQTPLPKAIVLQRKALALAKVSETPELIANIEVCLHASLGRQTQALAAQLAAQSHQEKVASLAEILALAEEALVDGKQKKEWEKELASAKGTIRQEIETILVQAEAEIDPAAKVRLLQQSQRQALDCGNNELALEAKAFLESSVQKQVGEFLAQASNAENLQDKQRVLKKALLLARSTGVYDSILLLQTQVDEVLGELRGGDCCICLEPLGNTVADVVVLPCNPLHKIHTQCYRQMSALGQGGRCPLDREPIGLNLQES